MSESTPLTVVGKEDAPPEGRRWARTMDARGRAPAVAVPLAMAVATGNPIGLIIGGGMKVYGEASGSSRVDGRVKSTAKEISDQLKVRFQQQGWIE